MGFEIKNGILKKHTGKTPDIIIPSCVTEIGKEACQENKCLKSVIITGNVKIINDSAFEKCTNLEKVIIMNGVTTINYKAFQNCTNLSEIVIPESVTTIGNNAFLGTKWLKNKQATEKNVVIINGIAIAKADNIGESVNLEGLKEIQSEIFKDCKQIKEFIISDGLKINNNAFFTMNDFNICLKNNTIYVNISVNKNTMDYYYEISNSICYCFKKIEKSLFDFIGADMEQKEILFDDLEIPEYRYPIAVFMASTYESEFFNTFIDVHLDKIFEYAENNAPDLLKFISGKY